MVNFVGFEWFASKGKKPEFLKERLGIFAPTEAMG